MTPFEVLKLHEDADEAAIRAAYLGLVRQFPPDREPERFSEISNAYEELKDSVSRVKARLAWNPRRERIVHLSESIQDARKNRPRLPTLGLLQLTQD